MGQGIRDTLATNMERAYNPYEIPIVTDKTGVIPRWMLEPRSSDWRFDRLSGRAVTIYLAEDDVVLTTAAYGHDDVVMNAEYRTVDDIKETVGQRAVDLAFEWAGEKTQSDNTAGYFEEMLRKVYDDPTIDLQHIQVKKNLRAGTYAHIYGYVTENS